MSKLVNVLHAGKISYSHGLKLQKFIANLHKTNETNADTIILLEHPPVYTVGIRTNDYTVEDEIRLKRTGTGRTHRFRALTGRLFRRGVLPNKQRWTDNVPRPGTTSRVPHTESKTLQDQY